MSYANVLPAATEALIRAEIGGISGVTVVSIEPTPAGAGSSLPLIHLSIGVKGWSPSLHLIEMCWRSTVITDREPEDQARRALDMLARPINRQRARLRLGVEHGVAAPLAFPDLCRAPIDHLLIDHGLAELMGDGLDREVETGVWNLHQIEHSGDEDRLIAHDWSILGLVFEADHEISDGLLYDGRVARLARMLPESALIEAAGRRFGEVVDGVPALARHVIREARVDGDGLSVVLEPRHVTFAELRRAREPS